VLSIYLTDKGRINVRDYGAIGDGSSHPLSDHYGTLADAQLFYPHATSLSDEMDWAALQAAANAATAAGGGRIHVPHTVSGYDIGSKTVTIGGSGVIFEAEDVTPAPTMRSPSRLLAPIRSIDVVRLSWGSFVLTPGEAHSMQRVRTASLWIMAISRTPTAEPRPSG
jgi:hypothetical protein